MLGLIAEEAQGIRDRSSLQPALAREALLLSVSMRSTNITFVLEGKSYHFFENSVLTVIQSNGSKPSVVDHACNPVYSGGQGRRLARLKPAWES